MSNKIVPAAMSEALKNVEADALTDDELNVVAGGATNRLVEAFLDGFYRAGGTSSETSSTGKSSVRY